MFDSFEPFQGLRKIDFDFTPSRYEMWIGGEMFKRVRTRYPLMPEVQEAGQEKVKIIFHHTSLHSDLAFNNIFDEFITSRD